MVIPKILKIMVQDKYKKARLRSGRNVRDKKQKRACN